MTAFVVEYTCDLCGVKGRPVAVRYREPGEDVVAYVQGVIVIAVAADHAKMRPTCRATKISNLKIPIEPGAEGIGERPEN